LQTKLFRFQVVYIARCMHISRIRISKGDLCLFIWP